MKRKFSLILFLSFTLYISYSQDFTIDSFVCQILIHKENGSVEVRENIYVDFHDRKRGIYRDIPYIFSNNDKRYETDISNIEVEGKKYKIKHKNGIVNIRIGDADAYLEGKQTYAIRYTVDGPFINTEDYQEFYWNITGNEWKAPINRVKYSILFPDSTAINEQFMKVYTGQEKSQIAEASIVKEGARVYGTSSRILNKGEGLTIAIRLPKDYIDAAHTMKIKPPRIRAAIPIDKQLPFVAFASLLLAGLIAFWKKLKGSVEEAPIESKPYPPLDLTPAEVGAFYDHIVHDRDIVSMLPYWANQGFVKMEHSSVHGETVIHKIKNLEADRPPYEYTLFNAIFSFGNAVALSDLKENFYNHQSAVKKQIKKEIIDMDMYDENYGYWFKSWRMWVLVPILLPLFIAAFIFGYWLVGIVLIITIVTLIVLTSVGRKPSEKGWRVKQDLKGFYAFLKNEQGERYPELLAKDPQYFEKVYPYAVAFNLDKNLINRIKPYQASVPFWYGYYGHYGTSPFHDFSDNFQPKEIVSAFTSYPASQGGGSGGSGGGGFSGGGFGGGGGGSW